MCTKNFPVVFSLTSLALVILLNGCATVQDTVYMQSVSVTGPVNLPPIHCNNDSTETSMVISPRFGISKNDPIEGTVEANPYSLPGKNLRWETSSTTFGVDVDERLWHGVALSFGLNYAEASNEQLWGGNAGLGFLFHGDNAVGRVEFGLQLQAMKYDAATVVEHTVTDWFSSGSQTTTAYFHDVDVSAPLGYYGSLILQSRNLNRLFNIFGQLALNRQVLTNFTPHTEVYSGLTTTYISTDTRTGNSATLLTFTPGLNFSMGGGSQFLLAVRIAKELEISDGPSGFLVQPVMQIDFGL